VKCTNYGAPEDSGNKKGEVRDEGEEYIMQSFVIYTHKLILVGLEILGS
jgi:hypothetical protein